MPDHEQTEDASGGEDRADPGRQRAIPDSIREAVEGAFAATGLTRDRAQDLTEKTRDRAQDLVGEVSKLGQDARDALEGVRLVSRDELTSLGARIDEIEGRLARIERDRGGNDPED